jgi:hypothetical protein
MAWAATAKHSLCLFQASARFTRAKVAVKPAGSPPVIAADSFILQRSQTQELP